MPPRATYTKRETTGSAFCLACPFFKRALSLLQEPREVTCPLQQAQPQRHKVTNDWTLICGFVA